MTFDELVIFYITLIGCTAKELTIESGLANGTISRYIHAQRKPTANSPTVSMIADGIVSLAKKQNIILDRDEIIESMFIASETDESSEHSVYRKNLRRLIDYMGMSLIDLGNALNYDPSYMSRLLAGHRRPYNLEDLKLNTARFFARYASHKEDIICRLADLYGCTPFEAGTDNKMAEQTLRFISTDHGTKHSDTVIGELLDRINEFDMESFREYLHIDSIKLPVLSENRIIDKRYNKYSQLKTAELDFIRNIEMTCTSGTIVMYCDMPLNIESSDRSFMKNLAFGIYTLIDRGVTVRMIHDVYRPADELLNELIMYIPLHMTGAVTPYRLKKKSNTTLMHLLHVSNTTALSGDARNIDEPVGSFHVTSEPESFEIYKQQAKILMTKSKPLVRIYDKNKKNRYISFLKRCPSIIKTLISYSTIPIFALSEDLLMSILGRYTLTQKDYELILRYRSHYLHDIKKLSNDITIEIIVPQIEKQPKSAKVLPLFLTDIFIAEDISLTYAEYMRLMAELKDFADSMGNVKLVYKHSPLFNDLSVCIIKNKLAVISKRSNPAIHFVTDHSDLVNSVYNFFYDS